MNQNWFMVSGAMDQDALAGKRREEKGGQGYESNWFAGSRATDQGGVGGGKSHESNWKFINLGQIHVHLYE